MLAACLLGAGYTTRSKTTLLQQTQQQASNFDASTCTSLSGKETDTQWCKASCGMIINPACPASFCQCEGEMPTGVSSGLSAQQEQANKRVAERDAEIAARDAEVTGAADQRDAEIAQRDADIESRIGGVSSARDDEIAARDADINARKPADTNPTAAASPIPPAPAAQAAAASPGPQKDWATGTELPTAPTAEYNAPAAQPVPEVPAVQPAGVTDPVGRMTKNLAQRDGFDATTCKSLSGKPMDDHWCKASCGMELNPACPSSFCQCEGEMPTEMDTNAHDTGTTATGERALTPEEQEAAKRVADRDAEIAARDTAVGGVAADRDGMIANRDADIEGRAPTTPAAGTVADRDAQIAQRDADINSRKPMAAATPEDRDAEIAARDADIATRKPADYDLPEASPSPAPAAAAPVAAEPAVVASPAPHVDWATGFELPKAPTATYDAPTLGATTEYKAPAAEVPAAVPEPPKVPGASP